MYNEITVGNNMLFLKMTAFLSALNDNIGESKRTRAEKLEH